jgi:hypothetical protein
VRSCWPRRKVAYSRQVRSGARGACRKSQAEPAANTRPSAWASSCARPIPTGQRPPSASTSGRAAAPGRAASRPPSRGSSPRSGDHRPNLPRIRDLPPGPAAAHGQFRRREEEAGQRRDQGSGLRARQPAVARRRRVGQRHGHHLAAVALGPACRKSQAEPAANTRPSAWASSCARPIPTTRRRSGCLRARQPAVARRRRVGQRHGHHLAAVALGPVIVDGYRAGRDKDGTELPGKPGRFSRRHVARFILVALYTTSGRAAAPGRAASRPPSRGSSPRSGDS